MHATPTAAKGAPQPGHAARRGRPEAGWLRWTLARSMRLSRRMSRARPRLRLLALTASLMGAFAVIASQLVHLALEGGGLPRMSIARPLATSWSRPDVLDRKGRLLATDIVTPSLFADPALILDVDEVVEKLRDHLLGLDERRLRKALSDRRRHFVWIRRGLTPELAQAIHDDLGQPGLKFRKELRRVYPSGRTAAHVLGHVDIDNRGRAGIERYIDRVVGIEAVQGAARTSKAPVRLSLDLGVQHVLREELVAAKARFEARAAAGLVMDVETGEMLGAVSLPDFDPHFGKESLEKSRIDRITGGTFELGSVFKAVTIAMALTYGTASPDRVLDVRGPLQVGRYRIRDHAGMPDRLSVHDIFIRSSNVGSALLAKEVGLARQRAFLKRIGLSVPMRTELGRVKAPELPRWWRPVHGMTIGFGHGIAVAPIQFAAAVATLVNGGYPVAPTFLYHPPGAAKLERKPILPQRVGRALRRMMRDNVLLGTGRRADVPGYEVGGKTGTAEMAIGGRYARKRVLSSFVAIFPASRPRYLTYVLLFEPRGVPETRGRIAASWNAAPTTAAIIRRIAPMLGLRPRFGEG